MGPVHPDAQDALNILLGVNPVEKFALEEINEALMIEKENLALIPDAYNEEEDEIQEEDDINDANF